MHCTFPVSAPFPHPSSLQVRNNSTLCAAPLLAHPLMRRRVQALHRFMDVLLFMLPSGTLLLPGGSVHGSASSAWMAAELEQSREERQ